MKPRFDFTALCINNRTTFIITQIEFKKSDKEEKNLLQLLAGMKAGAQLDATLNFCFVVHHLMDTILMKP